MLMAKRKKIKYPVIKSIKYKLLLYFLTLVMLPIITLGIVGNIIYSNTLEDQATLHTSEMINQVNKNLDFYVSEIERIIDYVSQDPYVIEFLGIESSENPNRVDVETQTRRVLSSVKDSYPQIAGILIATDNDLYISNEIYKQTRDPIYLESWYSLAQLNPSLIQLISKPIGRNLSTSLNYTSDDVVSVAKAIRDPENPGSSGVILIDFKLSAIENIIEGITLGKSGFVFVMDSLGSAVYAPVNATVYRVNDRWFRDSDSGSFVKSIGSGSYQIIYRTSSLTKWKTIGIFSLKEALKEVENQRYYAFFIGLTTLLLAILMAFFFTSTIVSPVNELKKLMAEAEGGNLDLYFESENNDEIAVLGKSFNNMIKKIKDLIELVYSEQKSKREAELKILQAQIKPHFLYNTLDTIGWMADRHGAGDIKEVVMALTNLFRIGLSRGKEMITLEQEIEHVQSYMIIQKVRYEEKLNYNISYDPAIGRYKVLKLILQPLVENAIYHGIKQKRGGGMITVTARVIDGNRIAFTIADDGAGIEPEKLQYLNDVFTGKVKREGKQGYGVFNTNERIRLTFGEEYGLSIESELGKGTLVTILHPLIKEDSENV